MDCGRTRMMPPLRSADNKAMAILIPISINKIDEKRINLPAEVSNRPMVIEQNHVFEIPNNEF